MFTGIIEEVGHILVIGNDFLKVSCSTILEDVKEGDSIAVNGVCLTVTSFDTSTFTANISNETRRVTKLAYIKNGDDVNLERAMQLSSRFGGHIVSGHIDCCGKIEELNKNGEFYNLKVSFDGGYEQYFVKKGSITIDGISLTICETSKNTISVAIIPHTYENTNLKSLKQNDFVNIEFDILGKYIEKNLLMKDNKNSITEDFLRTNGFM